ncbi:MAG: 3'-5' exoribonuclease YhaM family protein [Desulfatibacillaceae bacterium]
MKTTVADIRANDNVEEVFVAAEKNVRKKADGAPYLHMVFSDKTGRVSAVAWDDVERLSREFSPGDFVYVSATAQEYRGSVQLKVRDVARVAAEKVDPADFLPTSERDPDKTLSEVRRMALGLKSSHLVDLFGVFFDDAEFVDRLRRAPGAKMMHHAYLGGLVEHTFSVATLAASAAMFYNLQGRVLDRDMLVAGAILHDIGKMEEFVYETRIDLSEKGRLLGHIVMGLDMLNERIKRVPDFPEQDAMLLRHMIASHHGSRENGSPEVPRTLEALLLYMVDDMDAKLWGARTFMEADDTGGSWTAFNKPFSRFFYKNPADGHKEPGP